MNGGESRMYDIPQNLVINWNPKMEHPKYLNENLEYDKSCMSPATHLQDSDPFILLQNKRNHLKFKAGVHGVCAESCDTEEKKGKWVERWIGRRFLWSLFTTSFSTHSHS